MDIPAMFGRAVAEFDVRVRQVGDHQWQAAPRMRAGRSGIW